MREECRKNVPLFRTIKLIFDDYCTYCLGGFLGACLSVYVGGCDLLSLRPARDVSQDCGHFYRGGLKPFHLLAALLFFSSCQSIDVAEEGEEADEPVVQPVGVGDGTSLRPWTVGQVLSDDVKSGTEGWLIGYVVGAAYQALSNAEFSATTDYEPNVLLSADSLCTTVTRCVPVELTSSKMRQACAIPYNRSHFRHCLMVRGRIGTYFRARGFRSVDVAKWWDGLDLSRLDPHPQQWGDTIVVKR